MTRSYWILCILFMHYASNVQGSKAVKTTGFQNNLEMQEFRLPTSIVPTHYNLRLQPILDETPGYTRFTAPGSVKIVINCTEVTAIIKLHVLDINIIENSVGVTDLRSGQPLRILGFEIQPELQFFVINLDESLEAGAQYEIVIQFVTPVSQTRLDGMYLDSYLDPETNETRYVATTLFAAISARRCFPCFDEPQMKAVFTIELARKEGYHSLSNKDQIATEPLEGMSGWYVDKFAPSTPMSTYLVAMIVSDMTFEEAVILPSPTDNENTTIRVYAPYYLINRGGGVYAANQTKNVLSSFENYFDNVFMFNKLYSVSLPRFHFSAMENWQLITYNDRVLLYFPGETTEQERYRITSIIAHEVVHHYFGNLVTCEWWTWIWLNEGGATYFSHLGVEMTYPEFNPWDRFVTDVYQVAMDFDSTSETHPVANEPQSDIGGIYDDIAYQKGASLLRMMHSFLSEEVMQTAIRRYLKEKQFSNARQDDLFEIVQETAEELGMAQPASVKEIMDTWTHLSGYPLLRVSRINSTAIIITQEKFMAEPGNANEELWWIPISIAVISPTPKEYLFWMSSMENETILSIPDTELFIVNPRSEGYFRTLYSADLLLRILHYSKHECISNQTPKLSSAAKAKLLHDYMAFKKLGLTDIGVEIFLSEYLCLESESLIVWETVLKYYARELLQVYEIESYKTSAVNFRLVMKKNLLPKITGMVGKMQNQMYEHGEKAILYAELIFWTCFIDATQPTCAPYVEEEMDKWIRSSKDEEKNYNNASPFHVDVEDTFFCIAASIKESYWERIYSYMESITLPAAKTRIAHSLMCTANAKLLQRIVPQLEEEFRDFAEEVTTLKLPVKPENLPYFRTMLRLLYNEPARKLVRSFTGDTQSKQ